MTQSITKTQTLSFAQEAPLFTLPTEVLSLVLEQLDSLKEILSCSQTCKHWNAIVHDASAYGPLWHTLFQRYLPDYEGPTLTQSNPCERFQRGYLYNANFMAGKFVFYSLTAEKIVNCVVEKGNLIAFTHEQKVKMWDLKTHHCFKTIDLLNHAEMGHVINSRQFVEFYCFSESEFRLWNLETLTRSEVLKNKHTDLVTCWAQTEDFYMTGSNDATVKIWDLEKENCKWTLQHQDVIQCLSVYENKLASSSADHTTNIWDLTTGQCLHSISNGFSINHCFTKDRLIAAVYGVGFRVYDAETATWLQQINRTEGWTNRLMYANGMVLEFNYSRGRTITKWDLKTEASQGTFVHPDGEKFEYAWGSHGIFLENGRLIVANAMTGIDILDFEPPIPLQVTFDTGYGNSLVLCGDGVGLSWNPAEGKPLTCEGTDRWTIRIPAGAKEFKLVWKKRDGSHVWERGPNRKVEGSSPITISHIQFNRGK